MIWLKRIVLGVFLAIVALATSGLAYQEIASAIDRRAFPPPGELADISGRKIHYLCAGSGSPTVILEAGLGGFSSDWARVQEGVSTVTRVCSYDRAGSGWSGRGPAPRDGNAIVAELHALLTTAGIAGPYVLVGHSLGGLYVRSYAAAYPGEVSGMVLVDSTHPEQWVRRRDGEEQYASLKQLYGLAKLAARVGLVRLADFLPRDTNLPEAIGAAREAMGETSASVDTAADEFGALVAAPASLAAPGSLGALPLAVVTAGERSDDTPENAAIWYALQEEWAALSSNATHEIVDGADHMSLVTGREHSRAVVEAISRVVAAARTASTAAIDGPSRMP